MNIREFNNNPNMDNRRILGAIRSTLKVSVRMNSFCHGNAVNFEQRGIC
jgi:hypothetical protein